MLLATSGGAACIWVKYGEAYSARGHDQEFSQLIIIVLVVHYSGHVYNYAGMLLTQ